MSATIRRTTKQCGLCNRSTGNLGNHVRYGHRMSLREYWDGYYKPKCKHCRQLISYKVGFTLTQHRQFCSYRCRGLNRRGIRHPRYRGGFIACGYRKRSIWSFPKQHWALLWKMVTDGYVKGNHAFIFEHRATMAIRLGRPLLSTETVHHKNGMRSDNRPTNLELRISRHGPGATASELICPHCGKAYA